MKTVALSVALVFTIGCSNTETTQTGDVPQVYTTFYPTTYFTERIGGDRVGVVCPLPADEDPIFWMPSSPTIGAYQQADLIVINGAGFEKWVAKVSLPTSKLVDTAKPLAEVFLKFEGAISHSHGSSGEHSHEGIDGHTWLDPNNAKIQADEIHKALALLLPEHAEEFRTNYVALADELDELHQSFVELTRLLEDRHLLASHPAYNYLTQRYGWHVTNLDLDPEAMPDDATFSQVDQLLAPNHSQVILWESRPTDEIAARFQSELGLVSVVFSPCETLDENSATQGRDYLDVMQENVTSLREAISR